MLLEPGEDQAREVAKVQPLRLQMKLAAHRGKTADKRAVPLYKPVAAGKKHPGFTMCGEKVAYLADRFIDPAAVGPGVLSAYIGDELLVAITFHVEDDRHLSLVLAGPKGLRAQENAELQRHVEARQTGAAIELGT